MTARPVLPVAYSAEQCYAIYRGVICGLHPATRSRYAAEKATVSDVVTRHEGMLQMRPGNTRLGSWMGRSVACCACGGVMLLLTGCTSLLPSERQTMRCPWDTFHEAKTAYDAIQLNRTDSDELRKLGFDPFQTPNISILSCLDLARRFRLDGNSGSRRIAPDILDCIAAGGDCQGLEIRIRESDSRRYGNVLLDMFGFRRKVHHRGWEFNALLVLRDDVVVYKIWGGMPQIDRHEKRRNPLGPFQDPSPAIKKLGTSRL